ncbi:hypothetical protein [Chitinophaga sp. sic0106]|uniref:hypothetical protein n=1 Tax=Chitinophaga sp. sic0106 TaxID=2854785 RepID=UPI001C48BB7D|nr:hypothetical protein [Chitinophaga sp. sic0106]MBV7532084.1 hypothetical protein [Chitinophaga sp. sic0106]
MKSFYKLMVLGAALLSSCTKTDDEAAAPDYSQLPATVNEHWFGYQSFMRLSYSDDQIATYLAPDMDTTLKYFNPVVSKIWKYTKATYGEFGADPRLRLYLHDKEYLSAPGLSATLANYMDNICDYKNAVVVSSSMWKDTTVMTAVFTHEISHIVEGGSLNVKHSPTARLWGDSKFQDIFIYDCYANTGMTVLAEKWLAEYQTNFATYPLAKTYWFRDWWYPIYSKYGQTKVLTSYFKLLSENLEHKPNGNGFQEFTQDVNMGEFVHFMSGAAGVNLKEQAKIAFGWTMEYEQQLLNAQEDYPNVKYNKQ